MNNDLISRKYMKEAIEQFFVREKYYHPYSKGRKTIPTEEVLDIIDTAPAVEPKQGEWIITSEDNNGVHRICCPFCSYEKGSNNADTIIITFTDFPNFCEKCGAKMKGGTDND